MPTPISGAAFSALAPAIVVKPVSAMTELPLLFRGERGLEGHVGCRQIQAAHHGRRLGRALLAVHAVVLPFHREGTSEADVVQRPEDPLERNVAAPRRYEVPATPMIAKGQ